MKLPYILLAEEDADQRALFTTVFGKQIAYATVSVVEDGKSLLDYLSKCGWKDLPDLIVLNSHSTDMAASDILREMLMDTRYLGISKIVLMTTEDIKAMEECKMLGVKYFLKKAEDVFELESTVRNIDTILKAQLDFQ